MHCVSMEQEEGMGFYELELGDDDFEVRDKFGNDDDDVGETNYQMKHEPFTNPT